MDSVVQSSYTVGSAGCLSLGLTDKTLWMRAIREVYTTSLVTGLQSMDWRTVGGACIGQALGRGGPYLGQGRRGEERRAREEKSREEMSEKEKVREE
jgi:hypothetical protein